MLLKRLRDAISRRMKKLINNQAGFTLIELVMVIVILGILAATAVPKFLDLTEGAVDSVGNAIGGSLSSAAAIAYARSAIDNPSAPSYPECGITPAAIGSTGATVTPTQLMGAADVSGVIWDSTPCDKLGSIIVTAPDVATITGTISSAENCTWSYIRAFGVVIFNDGTNLLPAGVGGAGTALPNTCGTTTSTG